MVKGRKPYEEPRDKTCPWCGQGGLTRQKLLVHQEKQCDKKPAPNPVAAAPVVPPEPPIIPRPARPADEPDPLAPQEAEEPETEDEDEDDIPIVLVIIVALVVAACIALVMARDKVRGFIRSRIRPPGPGAVAVPHV